MLQLKQILLSVPKKTQGSIFEFLSRGHEKYFGGSGYSTRIGLLPVYF